jgi:hypothetical protein
MAPHDRPSALFKIHIGLIMGHPENGAFPRERVKDKHDDGGRHEKIFEDGLASG